jgi:iron complex outermembrane receptor protein
MKNPALKFCGAALAGIFHFASAAQAAQSEQVPYTMETVTVIAAPLSSPLQVTLDPKNPQQPLPASDATDYLRAVPGFAAVRTGGANSDMVFRGMFGSRLNVLSNGGYMLGGCGNRMDSPASYIAPENFDSVKIIKGPQTVLWGGGGSAGTILFERQPPRFSGPDARLQASLLAASYGRFDENLDLAAGNESFYVRAVGNHAQAGDYKDGGGNTIPSKWEKWNTDVALGFTPNSDTLIEISGGGGDGEARYADRGMDGSSFKRESLAFRFEKSNIGKVLDKIEFQSYYNYADHVMDNYSLRTPPMMKMMGRQRPMRMASNPSRVIYGGRAAATWNLSPSNSLISGVDVQIDEHRIKNEGWDKNITYEKYGIFSEMTTNFDERNSLVYGLRLDSLQARDLRRTSLSNGETRHKILPAAFIRFEQAWADPGIFWYAGAGYVERFPDYWELSQQRLDGGSAGNAFVGLNPEKTLQLDVGLQYKRQDTQVWISAYAGVIRDYILFNYDQSLAKSVRNIDARIAGAEIGFSHFLSEHLRFNSSLAYAWGENADSGGALPQMPPLEGRLGLSYERDNWEIGVLWRLAAAQTRIAENQGTVKGRDFSESAGFGILSISGSYRPLEHITLSAGVDNILDKEYAEHLNTAGVEAWGFAANQQLAEPGMTLWAKISVEF